MSSWTGIFGCCLRGGIAAALLWACLLDWPAARALAELKALPDHDFLGHAQTLHGEGRHAEALLVLDAGLQQPDADYRTQVLALRDSVIDERDSLRRRAQSFGSGALHGEGASSEALAGAVIADLFVFGDVRDLVLQSARGLRGDEVDTVIVALSAAGIVLTAVPSAGAGAALLKLARRSGALTDSLARQLLRRTRLAVRRTDAAPLTELTRNAAALSGNAGTVPSLRILRHVDHAGDLQRAARFSARPGGGFALWVSGRPGIAWLAAAGDEGAPLLLRAARKGPQGAAWLSRHTAVMLRPHPLLGITKGLYKGNFQQFAGNLLRERASAVAGVLAGWLLFEILLLGVRGRRLHLAHRQHTFT